MQDIIFLHTICDNCGKRNFKNIKDEEIESYVNQFAELYFNTERDHYYRDEAGDYTRFVPVCKFCIKVKKEENIKK